MPNYRKRYVPCLFAEDAVSVPWISLGCEAGSQVGAEDDS